LGEATTARYRWAPQLRVYDEMKRHWWPYVMSFNEPGFSSEVVHTDARGYRLSTRNGAALDNFGPAPGGEPTGLVVGASVTFGVGASRDEQTISSILNETSAAAWRNAGGKAISSTQELVLFMIDHGDFADLERVVLFSGVAELVVAALGIDADRCGPMFYLDSYQRRMNRRRLSARRRVMKAVFDPFVGPRTDWASASLGDLFRPQRAVDGRAADSGDVVESALKFYRRNLSIWSRLCRPLGVDVAFVLQPVMTWIDKRPSEEEVDLAAELDTRHSNTWNAMRDHFTAETHSRYAAVLAQICAAEGISFFDSNEAFGHGSHHDEWLFVDRVHLNDRGNRVAADYIRGCGLA